MKTIYTLLLILIAVFSAFGQARKPVKRVVKPATPLYETPVVKVNTPTQKVFIIKANGERLTGLFVGGDADFVTIKTENAMLSVKTGEINRIVFGENADVSIPPREGIATRIGSSVPGNAPDSISGGVLNGKAVSLVKPEYPAAARAVRASGAVNVQVTIDEQGDIVSASAVSGHPLLRQAAENAARSSKFAPTTLEGQPVSVTGIIVYNFVP